MTAYPAWTPASRAGIVPLHPYGFGTILGRSFVALRHNPRVLLGFALVVQTLGYVIVSVAVAGAAIASFSRLDTLVEGTEEFDTVMIGSIVLTGLAALVLGALAGGLSVLVQGVVVSEVASAVVAEKPTLRDAWRRVRPVFLRLIGYSLLTLLASAVVLAVVGGIAVLLGIVLLPLGIVVGILLGLGLIPLYLWLATKLFLVPSAMILEGVGIRRAIARSWVLTRRRFWPTFGVLVIISLAFGVVAQIISLPLSLLSSGLSTIVAPTGASDTSALIAFVVIQLVGQIGILLVQCIAVVVQSTSAVLVYVDARMRVEGLDHDLFAYVDARDSGAVGLPDPYRVGVGRAGGPTPTWGPPAGPGAAYAPAAPHPYGASPATAPAWPAPQPGAVAAPPAATPPWPAPQPGAVAAPPAATPPWPAPQPGAVAAPPAATPPRPTAVPPTPAAPAPAPNPNPSDPTAWAAPGSPPPAS